MKQTQLDRSLMLVENFRRDEPTKEDHTDIGA